MPKLTIVVGLPGAGKSHYCRSLVGECGNYFGDVCHPSRVQGPGGLADVVKCLADGRHCVMEDVSFCDRAIREDLIAWLQQLFPTGLDIQCTFFEKNVEQCLANIVADFLFEGRRHDLGERAKTFFHYHDVYDIPCGAMSLPVIGKYKLLAADDATVRNR